jgi:DNA polymerase III gamma/tau subunit
MTSFLIISEDKVIREAYALEFCHKENIQPVDITVLERNILNRKKSMLSIGIEDIKQLQSKLYFKPIKSSFKAAIIHEAHILTIEAQNAMLKILEEPPEQTYILLTADTKYSLLPTILSRCQLIELANPKMLMEKDEQEMEETLAYLKNITVADALKLAETHSKTKDEALTFLEKLILFVRQQLYETVDNNNQPNLFLVLLLKQLQKTYTLIKTTNVNLRLALEIFFLHLLDI